jgi:hypothetical protein
VISFLPRGNQLKGGFRAALFFAGGGVQRWRMIDVLIVAAVIGIIGWGYHLITHPSCLGARCGELRKPD